ncbi:MAG: hypothetical protein AB4290_21930 [Spirulina sp.]
MVDQSTLIGTDLIDCAKANARLGLAVATRHCGYGEDSDRFLATLKHSCQEIGVNIEKLEDLITEQQREIEARSKRILSHR